MNFLLKELSAPENNFITLGLPEVNDKIDIKALLDDEQLRSANLNSFFKAVDYQ